MENFSRFGRVLFGMGMLGFGALNLAYALPVPGIEPIPERFAASAFLTYATACVLIVGGIATWFDALRPRLAAITLGVMLFLWLTLLNLPMMVTHIHNGSIWTSAFECLVLCCSAWILAYRLSDSSHPISHDRLRSIAALARYGFGISLPVFGALHFIYWEYVASVIPTWIPGSPVFWTYFTGCAHVAAGLAILSGVKARLASICLGTMFTSWVLIVHIPRVFARPHDHAEWTSLLVAIGMSGGGWLMAGYFPQRTVRTTA
jgi:uncharacterized membrane protein YphA (DoxX/SURF4 family)